MGNQGIGVPQSSFGSSIPSSSSLSGALVQEAYVAPVNDANSPPLDVLSCMWGNCGATFYSLCDLVSHVNLQHLRASSDAPSDQLVPTALEPLSCHWKDCNVYPSSQSFPGPSTGSTLDSALAVLADHLLRDHLGMQVEHAPPSPAVASPHLATPPISPVSTVGAHKCSGMHACRWQGCAEAFTTCNDLTAHITNTHVGSGKSHYECHWEGCNRHDGQGFSSKQKICRHIQVRMLCPYPPFLMLTAWQSHTGHRPFQCKECQQYFSEAATLQQHMRRHTQEKPYVCDYPGCGKAFAITGALTIHKRTHNGLKPFKCSFCDRAFSESSNLSKHLRTHTGDRPYVCSEAGCEKAFARPDQLTRHMSVHRKKGKD
ncbi:hypothetical protein HWV62_4748 [Athelia sp. TMB]|nr:hypothetical protein HWV62_4748 [Athelia sp. TMB]